MSSFLSKINSPYDLKRLKINQLNQLAKEIRHFLINSVSHTGGHLSSNLGVVELTIALHYCFNSPKDKIIWDVGHQSYVHKILTGRREMFSTLRKQNGLSGFPKTSESIHDVFNTGHSSTSISAALGFAKARDILNKDYSVISVIGDGSLTSGMAFEALNNAGRSNTKMIVILNDNQMSISKNVGGLSKYLCEMRTEPIYLDVKEDIENLLKKIPRIGEGLARTIKNAKEGIKYFLIPGVLFEELGFTYLGPIDGHDIQSLINVLNRAKNFKDPVIIHVKTVKGKGYIPAELNPSKFHGVPSFDVKTGNILRTKKDTYSQVFGKKIIEIGKKNNKIVAITAAMPESTGLLEFAENFPDRFFDVGIAEQHAVTFAAGLAASGFKPIVAIYSSFLQRSYDQILHDVCLQKLPVIFAIDRAGIVGADGETHQGIFDLSYLSHIPNLCIIAPKNKKEFTEMIDFAVVYNAPIAIRYPKGNVSEIYKNHVDEIVYGKSEILQYGSKIVIIAVGSMNDVAHEVILKLKDFDINATFVNARFIVPIDEEMIKILSKEHEYIFTIEENVLTGGFGTSVLKCIMENNLKNIKVKNFTLPEKFIEHGTRIELLKKYGLDSEKIVKCILNTVNT